MMQKVLINCQTLQKDDIFHILKVNNYHPIEFDNENQVFYWNYTTIRSIY